jgi:glutathione S-transferase
MPILYCNHESGHSYKVALALSLMDIEFDQRPVDLNQPRFERAADFQKASLFGEVPTLVFDDGLAVCQSNVILDTLARRYGRLDGQTEAEQIRVREWLAWEANRLAMSLPHLRFSRMFTPAGDVLETWFINRMNADMDRLSEAVASNRFITGDEPTIADVSCCGYLFWADQARVDLNDWPAIVDWLDRIRALDGWRAPYDLLKAAAPILAGTRT